MLEKKNNNSNSVELEIEVKECEQSNLLNSNILDQYQNNPHNINNLNTSNLSIQIQEILNTINNLILNRNDYTSLISQLNQNYNLHFNNFSLDFNNLRELVNENIFSSQNVFKLLLNSQQSLFNSQSQLINDNSRLISILTEVTHDLSVNFEELSYRFLELQNINQNTINLVSNLLTIFNNNQLNKYTVVVIISIFSLIGYISYQDMKIIMENSENAIRSINDRLNVIEALNNSINLEKPKLNSDLKSLILIIFGFVLAKLKK